MSKYEGSGVTLSWAYNGGTVYTEIAQVRDISGPSYSRETVDSTTRDDANYWNTFIKGWKDGGELSFDVVFDSALATHGTAATGLLGDIDNDGTVLPKWRLTFPNNDTCTFDGLVSGYEFNYAMNEPISADLTVKVAGKPLWVI